jgi:hypothetical protein
LEQTISSVDSLVERLIAFAAEMEQVLELVGNSLDAIRFRESAAVFFVAASGR